MDQATKIMRKLILLLFIPHLLNGQQPNDVAKDYHYNNYTRWIGVSPSKLALKQPLIIDAAGTYVNYQMAQFAGDTIAADSLVDRLNVIWSSDFEWNEIPFFPNTYTFYQNVIDSISAQAIDSIATEGFTTKDSLAYYYLITEVDDSLSDVRSSLDAVIAMFGDYTITTVFLDSLADIRSDALSISDVAVLINDTLTNHDYYEGDRILDSINSRIENYDDTVTKASSVDLSALDDQAMLYNNSGTIATVDGIEINTTSGDEGVVISGDFGEPINITSTSTESNPALSITATDMSSAISTSTNGYGILMNTASGQNGSNILGMVGGSTYYQFNPVSPNTAGYTAYNFNTTNTLSLANNLAVRNNGDSLFAINASTGRFFYGLVVDEGMSATKVTSEVTATDSIYIDGDTITDIQAVTEVSYSVLYDSLDLDSVRYLAYINDSANVVKWEDTITKIATRYDLECKLKVTATYSTPIDYNNSFSTLTAYTNYQDVTYNWDSGLGSGKTYIAITGGSHNVVVSKAGCTNDTAFIFLPFTTTSTFIDQYGVVMPPLAGNDTVWTNNYHPTISGGGTIGGSIAVNQIPVGSASNTIEGSDNFKYENDSLKLTGAFYQQGNTNLNEILFTGSTKTAGAFYTGTAEPTNTNQLNFDGFINNIGQFYTGNTTRSMVIGNYNDDAFRNIESTGYYNLGIGYGTRFYSLTTGRDNIGVGNSLYVNLTTGNFNLAIQNSLASVTEGSYNVSIGNVSGNNTTTGDSNIFIGNTAGYNLSTQSGRIIFNSFPRSTLNGDTTLSPIYIYQAATTADQQLYLNGNVNISDDLTVSGAINKIGNPSLAGVFFNESQNISITTIGDHEVVTDGTGTLFTINDNIGFTWAGDTATVITPGMYRVYFTLSYNAATGASLQWQISIYVNGVEVINKPRGTTTTNLHGSVDVSIDIDLIAGDDISFRISNETSTTDANVSSGSFYIDYKHE